jgi:hypothetical protein
MPNVEIKVRGLEQVPKELRFAAAQGVRGGLERIGIRGSALVQNNINTPFNGMPAAVATGNLVNSVHGDIVEGSGVNTIIIAAHAPSDVYVGPVETGTRPHFPPPSALLPWVMLRFNPGSEKEALSIAFAVAQNIRKRGTQGHFMFERAVEQLSGEAPGIMERAIADALSAAGYKGGRA